MFTKTGEGRKATCGNAMSRHAAQYTQIELANGIGWKDTTNRIDELIIGKKMNLGRMHYISNIQK